MFDAFLDALLDTLKILPVLFITYLLIEIIEHKAGNKVNRLVAASGKAGPLLGSCFGLIPQCGFSGAIASLFAAGTVSLGTLIAVFLTTSDEMLPILISEKAPVKTIGLILLGKILTGMIVGAAVDAIVGKFGKQEHEHIHEICEHDHCHCEEGILKSALHHTVQIAFYIFLIGLALNTLLHFVGEDVLGSIILNRPILGPVLASLVGLIPNCAGSVVITQLYLTNVISTGAAFAGLLTGSGVGLLILFRVNHDRKENFRILALLYGIGVVVGILLEGILRAIA